MTEWMMMPGGRFTLSLGSAPVPSKSDKRGFSADSLSLQYADSRTG